MTQSPFPGVTEVLRARRSSRTERLYRCANGYGLGAIKGGALTLGSDEAPWEIFVLAPEGVCVGESVGFLTEAQVEAAAVKLAAWTPDTAREAS